MLVLSRKIGERIYIEPGIEIAIVDVRGGRVRIGVDAPQDIRIRRTAGLQLRQPPRRSARRPMRKFSESWQQ